MQEKPNHQRIDLSNHEKLRYSRHLVIPQVGEEGQKKLKNSQVLVVGVGGLGSSIALYLAAAGIGRIGIIDFDIVDESNLQRQIIHQTSNIGLQKVESARSKMKEINPLIQVDIFPEPFNTQNAERLSAEFDILLDGTDNLATRYLINDVCFFQKKPYVYGSVFEFEGHASVFDSQKGPCYRCLFPATDKPENQNNDNIIGVFGVLPGTIGTIQATEAIKILLDIGTPLIGKLLLYDALEMSFQTIQAQKNPNCRLCSQNANIHSLNDAIKDYPI